MTRHDDAVEAAARQWCEFDWNDPEEVSPDEKRQWIAEAREVVDYYLAHMRPEVTSVEELEKLHPGTIVRDLDGDAWVKGVDEDSHTWWTVTGSEDGFNARGILRPARVLHWGDA